LTASEAPNPWSTLHDDASTYITLATALLGVSATFATDILSSDSRARVLVFVGWMLLVGSIVCSISAKGKIFAGLKGELVQGPFRPTLGWLNAAVYLLLLGTLVLALGALRGTAANDGDPIIESIEIARETAASIANAPEDSLVVKSVARTSSNTLVIAIVIPGNESILEVEIDTRSLEVLGVSRT
jgi:hypothetical protein